MRIPLLPRPKNLMVAPGEATSNTTLQLRPSAFTRLEKFLRRLDAFRRQEVIPQL